ncbi:tyrosine-type recombinase/integrase [Mesorhizobium sp. L-8-3]|uniref:tyrosine-type recombinase/integrase n=1 Tax=Mesorhizobium sp. L-8-3 TaxID=2744522 RepID=UPI0019289252|nr:tyrosine-type recombinase/integrase [Mesorhizobium sp. L-8-3]BCH22071.1 integrase [Mesorhizobium sp. L-8-3]
MATDKLTKRAIDGLKPAAKAFLVYDTELKGFAVRVAPTGAMTWQVEYRPYPGGREVAKRRMALGATTALSPDEARRKARDILSAAAKGEDPAKDRGEKRREMKVSALVDLYEKEGCYVLRGKRQGEPMKPKTKAYTVARLRNHVVPLLGNRRVTEVTASDIERMVRDITAGKTAKDEKQGKRRRIIVRGGDGAARKVARDVSAMFTWAIRSLKIVTTNPCETAAIRKTDNRRTRYLSLDEVERLGKALEVLQSEGVNPKALDITRLWALTGCRRDEIAALKWSEVDFEHSCLRLAETKTGASIRPLAAPALALLSSIGKEAGSPYVFPATSGEAHFQGTKRVWPKAVALAKLSGVTPHTLRHTLGSAAVSIGETLVMTGAILGHSEMRSTQIYAHVQQDPAARAAARAVKPIAAALSGKKPAKVVPMKRRGA